MLHEVFTPSKRELEWVHDVITAFEAAGGSALQLPSGEFVDLPVASGPGACWKWRKPLVVARHPCIRNTG